jgi:hypothetical protein
MVECLPSKGEILSSTPVLAKTFMHLCFIPSQNKYLLRDMEGESVALITYIIEPKIKRK